MMNEMTKLSLLRMAYDVLLDRIPYDEHKGRVVTTEAIVEEARKLETFFSNLPKKSQPKKAEFLTEDK